MTREPDDRYYTHGIDVPETPQDPSAPPPWGATRVVGQPRPRVDAYERVSGTAVYPSDVTLPRMLYGAILRSPHANAVVRRIEADAAAAMPGVHAVLSGLGPVDRSLEPFAEAIRTQLFDPNCRFEGEVVAAVAAETPYAARDALRAMVVEYEQRPFVSDELRALDQGAPPVHEGGNRVSPPGSYQRGDVEAGLAEADVVLERDYRTACEIHTPLEPHGCVARWDGDELTLWESTQGVFNVQAQVAAGLGLPLSKVRVIGHYMGGGFGSKLQAGKYSLIAALLAKQTARPVKLILTREETFLAAGNRPPSSMWLRAGVKRDGTLTALEFRGVGASGAYPAGGTSSLDWLVRDLYACPNVRSRLHDAYVNAGPARPFRAPGHPQGAWALEQMMDELADAIGMDPVQLRLRNVPTVSQGRGGQPYTTTGLRQCMEDGAAAFGWDRARREAADARTGPVRRGVGMAAGLWAAGGGGPPSTAIVKLFADGSVNLNLGASDIGTGTKTVMAMVVAEELGVDPNDVQIEHADTGTTPFASASGGSKTVPTESPAVRAAALDVKRQLLDLAAEELRSDRATLSLRDGAVVSSEDATRVVPVPELRSLRRVRQVTGVGYRGPNPADKVVTPFVAQFCEVEVNVRTGEVRVLRFLAAHDSGRIMNRLTCQNQVFGGITMGIGLGMTEQRVLDADQTGKMVNANWHDYKIPTALDVPHDLTFLPLDVPDDEANTAGAKGIGEPATIPTAAAVANAIAHATGVRMSVSPLNPAGVLQALVAAEEA